MYWRLPLKKCRSRYHLIIPGLWGYTCSEARVYPVFFVASWECACCRNISHGTRLVELGMELLRWDSLSVYFGSLHITLCNKNSCADVQISITVCIQELRDVFIQKQNNTTFRNFRFHPQVIGRGRTYWAGADRMSYCQCLRVSFRHLNRASYGTESSRCLHIMRHTVQTTETFDGSWPKVGVNTPNNAQPLTSRFLLLDRWIWNNSEWKEFHLSPGWSTMSAPKIFVFQWLPWQVFNWHPTAIHRNQFAVDAGANSVACRMVWGGRVTGERERRTACGGRVTCKFCEWKFLASNNLMVN